MEVKNSCSWIGAALGDLGFRTSRTHVSRALGHAHPGVAQFKGHVRSPHGPEALRNAGLRLG